ncbi:bacteriohemerythrin [Methylocucumis oryzae]|uniref:Hemerythrin n=1 Tax=Methylocucumis oryzae TaxID=1632867 RepID=A0A0F3IKE8_9GAMM|nr:hemerythrin family protein [Methylocucumis oryzae]KJV07142.1 hemerythrin [Methylocucumis oryzae]
MALLEKTAALSVAYTAIDEDHAEFINLLNALDMATNADFPALFQHLYEHTEQHFERENVLMTRSAYAGITDHKAEHQRVLGEFKQFKSRVDKGLISFGRAFIKDRLPQWLVLHVTTMDTALATHLNNQPPS